MGIVGWVFGFVVYKVLVVVFYLIVFFNDKFVFNVVVKLLLKVLFVVIVLIVFIIKVGWKNVFFLVV